MTTTPSRTPLTARCSEDLIALAPVVLGFWPEESIVLLTFGAARPFHARVDLPPREVQDKKVRGEVCRMLLGPAQRHGVRAVVLLYFTSDLLAAEAVHTTLARGCRRARIQVVSGVVADGHAYVDLGAGGGRLGPPTPYDVTIHPFVLDALVSGQLPHRSRDEMAAGLELAPVLAAPVLAALADGGLLDTGPPADGRAIGTQGAWVEQTVARAVATGELPRPGELARLLWTLQVPLVRDAAWSLLDRAGATAHVRFWTDVLRRAPDPVAAAPAALLGWSAWQAGDGALAWAAVDRCRRSEPAYPLAADLAKLLEHAVPPESWTGVPDWRIGLPRGGGDAH